MTVEEKLDLLQHRLAGLRRFERRFSDMVRKRQLFWLGQPNTERRQGATTELDRIVEWLKAELRPKRRAKVPPAPVERRPKPRCTHVSTKGVTCVRMQHHAGQHQYQKTPSHNRPRRSPP